MLNYESVSAGVFIDCFHVVTPKIVEFSLLGIDPESSVAFRLPLDLIYNREYIEDFRPMNEKIDIYNRRMYKKLFKEDQLKKYYNDTGIVTIEVAVYRHEDVRLLLQPFCHYPMFYRLEYLKGDFFLGSEELNRVVPNFIPVTLTILTSD